MMKLGNLKCDFMSHTNEIGVLVRNPINAVVMSIKLTYIVYIYYYDEMVQCAII